MLEVCSHPLAYLRKNLALAHGMLAKQALARKIGQAKLVSASGKLKALVQLMQDLEVHKSTSFFDAKFHKVLLFAQSKHTLNMLQEQVFRPGGALQGVRCLRLDGDVPAHLRQQVVDAFNADDQVGCLLSTTKVGGGGDVGGFVLPLCS